MESGFSAVSRPESGVIEKPGERWTPPVQEEAAAVVVDASKKKPTEGEKS